MPRAVATFLLFVVLFSGSRLDAQLPPAPVAAAALIEREVVSGQTFIATVMPTRSAIVGSAVAGRVTDYPVQAGYRVEQGDTLAQLLTATISLELAAAEAELTLRKEELRELENGSRPDEIKQAEAAMIAAKARMEYESARSQRLSQLTGATAREERDEALSRAREAEQEHRRAVAAHALAVAGPREEQKVQAAARVAVQQAIVDKIEDQIRKYTVVTRFAGYVAEEHTEAGEWLQVGDPVAKIVHLDEVDVIAQVVEDQIPFVEVGATVRVEIPALPHQAYTGRVVSIVPQADARARTFPVAVRVTNVIDQRGPQIKAGMHARVMLPTGARRKALLTPKDALVLGGPQPIVYVVTPGEDGSTTARPVPVRLGVADGSLVQVIGELKAGDKVVVLGNERLRPGQEIRVTREIDLTNLPSDRDASTRTGKAEQP